MLDHLPTFALSVFTGFFAIMNPIANAPIFLSLVEGKNEKAIRIVARTASLTAFLIVLCFVLLGKYIFELFGITIPAFKITGGILLFYVGFEMLLSKRSQVHSQDSVDSDDSMAISPLAIPILAGPGTIVTAMNFVPDTNYSHIAIVIGVFALMILLTYFSFISAERLMKLFGKNIITVISKLMGLILAIMGTGMVMEGIKIAFLEP